MFFVSEVDVIVNVAPTGATKINAHAPATNVIVARREQCYNIKYILKL